MSDGLDPMEKMQESRVEVWTGSVSLGSAGSGCVLVGNSACPRAGSERTTEGILSKYTNIIQGWQNRYFVLDPELGQLQYFVNEQGRSQKPRGSLPLIGASVMSSDEAPHMFIISSANGEIIKLRAVDATEQHVWMTQIQVCSRRHSDSSARVRKLKDYDEYLCVDRSQNTLDTQGCSGRARSVSLLPHDPLSSSPASQRRLTQTNIVTITHHKSPAAARRAKNQYPQRLLEVRAVMNQAEGHQKNLVESIETLPTRGPLSCLDQDLLLLKATSAATLSCLGECLNILQQSGHINTQPVYSCAPSSDNVPVWSVPKCPSGEDLRNDGVSAGPSPSLRKNNSLQNITEDDVDVICVSDEEIDTEDNTEEDLGVLEDQRSVILHLLSQLKLGMDLTRVMLPTFILEKRSLLEMYANFMAHPDLFLAISSGSGPEERMVRFLEYYLTAFHEGRKGAVAKKPYNPVLGETFHCSWEVPRDRVRPLTSQTHPVGSDEEARADQDCYRLRFVAEQVSHHPPVSGFYCECAERGICVNSHVWTKSKFMGMSVGVSMVGEGVLYLRDHGEEYVFTFPSAYARSILTVPWVEMGGKVTISCVQTGYSANVTFHTKPFYGGKVHRVTGEVKQSSSGIIVCKAQGEWNGTLEFTYSSGETKVIDTSKLPVIRKRIRPVEKQGRTESRRLWQYVTRALKDENVDLATEHKHVLEEHQRSEESRRTQNNTSWKPKYFSKEGDGWVYKNPLWKTLR